MGSSSKRYENKHILFIMLCLLAFIRPESLLQIPGVSTLYNMYRIMVVILLALQYIPHRRKYGRFFLLWIAFESFIVATTVIHGGNVFFAVQQMITVFAIGVLFELYKSKPLLVYKAIYRVFGFFVILNFISILLYPDGMYVTGVTNKAYENWFLGFKNKHIVYNLPLLAVTILLGKRDSFCWNKIAMLVITLFCVMYVGSTTQIVAVSVFLIISFLPFVHRNYRVFNLYTYFTAAVVMFVAIPVFRLQYLASYLLVSILHKDVDLTNRTFLWNRAFDAIAEHPVIGWGEQSNEVKHALYESYSIISAHNQILEYLYVGGIILISLYALINIMLAEKAKRYQKQESTQILAGLYFALQVALIAEVYTDPSMYMIYFMVWYMVNLSDQFFVVINMLSTI